MDYTLHTTVDITRTGQYRHESGKEMLRWKEQNFQTVVQTLGMRANISYKSEPVQMEIKGSIVGFNTNNIIRVWQFSFSTEREDFYNFNGNPIGYLIEDFNGIPFIAGLDESMEQSHDVFVTDGPAKNIVFYQK